MSKIYLILLFLVGVINFVPIIGLLSLDKINQTYGLSVVDNNLAILLRHRALIFGLIGGLILYSVFNTQYQGVAIVIAAISMVGYLLLFGSVGGANQELLKAAKIDIVGIVLLALAIGIKFVLLRSH